MSFAHRDLFETWRLILGTACSVYAIVVTARSLWMWVLYLSGSERVMSLARRYLLVQLLRLRLRPFAGELVQIGLWLAVLIVLLNWHA